MPGKKGGENTKKAAGNAKKAEVAAQKQAAVNAKVEAEETEQWSKGAKTNSKKQAADEKRASAAAKKAERDALLAEEEANQRSTPKGAGAKTATKKSKGLDLAQLDSQPTQAKDESKNVALNASGIQNALDALSLTGGDAEKAKIDRHPERRFKAAYAAFEARRMPEIEQENPGLRKNQREQICRKEFEKSEENPFNQVHGSFDTSKEELARVRQNERDKIEGRLGS